MRMNISSSVVTRPRSGHASQIPSPAPGLLADAVVAIAYRRITATLLTLLQVGQTRDAFVGCAHPDRDRLGGLVPVEPVAEMRVLHSHKGCAPYIREIAILNPKCQFQT